jgi:predicted DNA-binding transcriptional regulator YafY
MESHTDYAAILDQFPLAAVESVWLGALLTVHFAEGEVAKEARKLLDGLEAIRTRTLEASANPAILGNSSAKSMAPASDSETLRQALIHEYKLKIFYKDKSGRVTERIVWPLDTEHYGPKGAMLCWCEKRQDFRHFRFDRVQQLSVLPEKTKASRKVMAMFAQITMSDDFE